MIESEELASLLSLVDDEDDIGCRFFTKPVEAPPLSALVLASLFAEEELSALRNVLLDILENPLLLELSRSLEEESFFPNKDDEDLADEEPFWMLVFLCPKGTLTELRVAMVVDGDQLQPQDNNDNNTPVSVLLFEICCVLLTSSFVCGFWRGDHAASTSKNQRAFSGGILNLRRGRGEKQEGGLLFPQKIFIFSQLDTLETSILAFCFCQLTTTYASATSNDVRSVFQASLAAAAAAAIIFCYHTNHIGTNFLHNTLTLFEPQSCGAVTSCLR